MAVTICPRSQTVPDSKGLAQDRQSGLGTERAKLRRELFDGASPRIRGDGLSVHGLMGYEMINFAAQSRWYAVLIRSRQEKIAAATLDALGVHQFLPITTELHQWSDRKQVVNLPLFPGYLFVQMNMSHETSLRVRKVSGVVNFVGNQSGPLPIPDCQIEDIRTILARGVQCSPHPFLSEGDRVRVVRGLLAGIEGRFVRSGSKDQLIITVEMIQRSLALNVSWQDVERVALAGPREFSKPVAGNSSLSA